MSRVVFSEEARSDLFEIWTFLAREDERAADKLEREIMGACAFLADHPGIGHRRPDLSHRRAIRFHVVRTWYLVVYEVGSNPLLIVRILHGARDVRRELKGG